MAGTEPVGDHTAEVGMAQLKLDIGSGPTPLSGHVGVDLYAQGADIINAPMDQLPYPDGIIYEINCSHALEHIPKVAVIPTLQEWYRVLMPGGKLTVEVPDLVWVCENWLENQNNSWDMDAIFGDQSTPGQFHQTGFSRQLLLQYLYDAGFHKTATVETPFTHNQLCIKVTTVK